MLLFIYLQGTMQTVHVSIVLGYCAVYKVNFLFLSVFYKCLSCYVNNKTYFQLLCDFSFIF